MCGIAGIFTNHQDPVSSMQAVREAMKCLQYRGPDDEGTAQMETGSGQLSLGHTRLSIIDLSEQGRQPMNSLSGRYSISFNGEIYNYKELRQILRKDGHSFNTDTDTEVLINCWEKWGVHCLKKLKGMFAFVLYDRETQRLWVVRDAFGIKPLYYYSSDKIFAFASEIPALLKLLPENPEFNQQRCYDYLMFGRYDHTDETFFNGINQLQPGHYFSMDLSGEPSITEPIKWWWPDISEKRDISYQDAVVQVRNMFLENITMHLRSDVPLGAALSGGIDSSAVVCAMRWLKPDMPIHTFSYIASGSHYNEEKWVDIVNQKVGAVPHKVSFSPDEMLRDLENLIQTQGEPFGSTSLYAQYRVFQKARECGITVTLDGQGADELLAGYDGYPIPRIKSLLERREFGKLIRFIREWKEMTGSSNRLILKYLRSALVNSEIREMANRFGRKPNAGWVNYNSPTMKGINLNPTPPVRTEDGDKRRLVEALREAVTNQSLAALLRHGDRNSMRWSVESRVPFLTTDFAEYLLQLPEEYLISDRAVTKNIFREAMRGIVPDQILDRRDKIGFQTPENSIFKSIKPEILDSIKYLEYLGFIDVNKLKKDVKSAIESNEGSKIRVWPIFNLAKFIELQ